MDLNLELRRMHDVMLKKLESFRIKPGLGFFLLVNLSSILYEFYLLKVFLQNSFRYLLVNILAYFLQFVVYLIIKFSCSVELNINMV